MRVFVSAVGQYDNVGDTVLRRAYLDVLRTLGPLEVYLGDKTDGYASALRLHEDDRIHRAGGSWRREISRALAGGRDVYAFDTGETEATRPFARRYLRLAPLLAVSRLRGGLVVQAGVGVRESTPWRLPIAAVLRLASTVTWRDEQSRRMMGLGSVTPDWAFALGADEASLRADTDRPLLAVAIRQGLEHAARDRPDDAWTARVRGLADSLGLDIVVTAQIERDGPLALDLAERLGGEAVVWLDDDHARQEQRLREAYRRSAAVLTDRLHAAVIAATEGAVPIALVTGPADKVMRTLEGAGIVGTSVPRALEGDAVDTIIRSVGRRDEVVDAVLDARGRIDRLGFALRERARRTRADG